MAYAICISCGSNKRRPFARCKRCGYSPAGDNVAMAKSLILSTRWVTDDGEPRRSKEQLRGLQASIQAGEAPDFDANELSHVVTEKEAWDKTPDVSWLRLILLTLAILSVPVALFVIGWLIRRMR